MPDTPIEKWTILKQEDVSPSHWFPLLRHTVKLPNGLVLDDYYLSPLGNVVQILALTPQHDVVFVKQYKHGLGEIILELPGGMQQHGKDIIQSALNELEEETGIKAKAADLISLGKIANNPTKTNQVTYGFILFNAEFNSVQKPDPAEVIAIQTIPARQILKMANDGEIWVTDSLSFIFKAAMRYPEVFGFK